MLGNNWKLENATAFGKQSPAHAVLYCPTSMSRLYYVCALWLNEVVQYKTVCVGLHSPNAAVFSRNYGIHQKNPAVSVLLRCRLF